MQESVEEVVQDLVSEGLDMQEAMARVEIDAQETRAQLLAYQRGREDEVVRAHDRISTLEAIIMDIQARHQTEMQRLLDEITELRGRMDAAPSS